jgi:hypothetical protein
MAPLDVPELIRSLTTFIVVCFGLGALWVYRDKLKQLWEPLTGIKGLGFELTKTAEPQKSLGESAGIRAIEASDPTIPALQNYWNERGQLPRTSHLTFDDFESAPDQTKQIVWQIINRDVEQFVLQQGGYNAAKFEGPVHLQLPPLECVFAESYLPYLRHLKEGNRTVLLQHIHLSSDGSSDDLAILTMIFYVAAPAIVAKTDDSWTVVIGLLDGSGGEGFRRIRDKLTPNVTRAIEAGHLHLIPISVEEDAFKEIVVNAFNVVAEYLGEVLEAHPEAKDLLTRYLDLDKSEAATHAP